MYTVDASDRVVGCADAPLPDSGAALPFIISNEQRLLLAYMAANTEAGDTFSVELMTPDSQGYVALVEFNHPRAHMFGPPNDETFSSHPLANRGLRPYGSFEVIDSSWIRQLIGMNRARHPWNPYEGMRHFIFSFHDSTFECVAKSLAVNLREGSVRDVMFEIMQKLQGP